VRCDFLSNALNHSSNKRMTILY